MKRERKAKVLEACETNDMFVPEIQEWWEEFDKLIIPNSKDENQFAIESDDLTKFLHSVMDKGTRSGVVLITTVLGSLPNRERHIAELLRAFFTL